MQLGGHREAMSRASASMRKFGWFAAAFQVLIVIIFIAMVRLDRSAYDYDPPGEANEGENPDTTHLVKVPSLDNADTVQRARSSAQIAEGDNFGQDSSAHEESDVAHETMENIQKYPLVVDIQMMLYIGFGFLMTYLRKSGFSAIGLTMFLTCLVTQWSTICIGLTHIHAPDMIINITLLDVLEGSLTAGAVLISFGAVIGKLNPIQLLVMAVLEVIVFTVNFHIGYNILGVLDAGGVIFIHLFGAYFGLAVSFVVGRTQNLTISAHRENSTYVSDILSLIGCLVLWIFWPSFNSVLVAAGSTAIHRSWLNTWLSLTASTVATFIISALDNHGNRLNAVDIANATLAGGIAVGAVSDYLLFPSVALIAGLTCGSISAIGYHRLKDWLNDNLGVHDTCGVNNLHGIPALFGSLLSVIICYIASPEMYGIREYYAVFPSAVPPSDSTEFNTLHHSYPSFKSGEGRTASTQALYQLASIIITLLLAITSGLITGLILRVEMLFNPMTDDMLFDDQYFWHVPEHTTNEEDPRGAILLDAKSRPISPASDADTMTGTIDMESGPRSY